MNYTELTQNRDPNLPTDNDPTTASFSESDNNS